MTSPLEHDVATLRRKDLAFDLTLNHHPNIFEQRKLEERK